MAARPDRAVVLAAAGALAATVLTHYSAAALPLFAAAAAYAAKEAHRWWRVLAAHADQRLPSVDGTEVDTILDANAGAGAASNGSCPT